MSVHTFYYIIGIYDFKIVVGRRNPKVFSGALWLVSVCRKKIWRLKRAEAGEFSWGRKEDAVTSAPLVEVVGHRKATS